MSGKKNASGRVAVVEVTNEERQYFDAGSARREAFFAQWNQDRTVTANWRNFIITPTNISVLSRASVTQKIHELTQLLAAKPDIEFMCVDARENFDDNKRFLDELKDAETNPDVRALIEKDRAFP